MRPLARVVSWFVRWVLGLGIPTFALYYSVLHLGMRVPVKRILAPWLALFLLVFVGAPILHWLGTRAQRGGGDLRIYFVACGAVVMAGTFALLHYASALGFLTADAAHDSYVIGLVAIPLCVVLLYRFRRVFFPRLFPERSERSN